MPEELEADDDGIGVEGSVDVESSFGMEMGWASIGLLDCA